MEFGNIEIPLGFVDCSFTCTSVLFVGMTLSILVDMLDSSTEGGTSLFATVTVAFFAEGTKNDFLVDATFPFFGAIEVFFFSGNPVLVKVGDSIGPFFVKRLNEPFFDITATFFAEGNTGFCFGGRVVLTDGMAAFVVAEDFFAIICLVEGRKEFLSETFPICFAGDATIFLATGVGNFLIDDTATFFTNFAGIIFFVIPAAFFVDEAPICFDVGRTDFFTLAKSAIFDAGDDSSAIPLS